MKILNKKLKKKKTKEKEEKNQEIKKLQEELDNLKKTTNTRNEEYIRNKKDIKNELIEAIINDLIIYMKMRIRI